MQQSKSSHHLFSFAVISDTHLNHEDFGTDSPFEVNKLANRRLRYVIEELNSRDLAHVIHLGDVVHPVPSKMDLFEGAAAQFFEQIKALKHPIYLIPGNHDVGDKPISWGPSGSIRQSFVDAWSSQFGEHFFEFTHIDVSFIGINAQLLGSGLPLEKIQWDWLLRTLEKKPSSRVMLFTHYPPFLLDPDENEHYDNLGKPNRCKLLNLIEKHSVEALFAGHVHHIFGITDLKGVAVIFCRRLRLRDRITVKCFGLNRKMSLAEMIKLSLGFWWCMFISTVMNLSLFAALGRS